MATIQGSTIEVKVSRETVRGTAANTGKWVPKAEFTYNDRAEYIREEASYGNIHAVMDGDVSKRMADGNLSSPVYSENVGYVLGAAFGSFPNPSSLGDGVYSHTFVPANNAQHQTLTIQRKDANEHLQFALSSVQSVEFNFQNDEYVSYSAELLGKSGTTTSGASTYTVESKFRPQDVTVTIANTVAGLGAGTVVATEDLTLTIEKNVEDYQVLGSVELNDIHNNRFEYSGSMTILWNALTFKQLFTEGDKQAFRIRVENLSETVGSASANPSLTLTIVPSLIEEWALEEGNDEVVRQTVGFTGVYDVATGNSINAVLINETASY